MNIKERYLELLKKALINELYIENEVKIIYMVHCLAQQEPISNRYLVSPEAIPDEYHRSVQNSKAIGSMITLNIADDAGTPQPAHQLRNFIEFAHSMIGRKRMDNIQFCIESIIREGIPGDLIETGVWRGGATIFMRGVLAAHNVDDRTVWVADSFEGLPVSTAEQDLGIDLTKERYPFLAVNLDRVKDLFRRYDLLDEQVKFLKGWFRETLPAAPIEKLSLLRLDGDLYESTMDGFMALYDKVSPGGYVIVDDYNALEACRAAVHDFRKSRTIEDEIVNIDEASIFWRKGNT